MGWRPLFLCCLVGALGCSGPESTPSSDVGTADSGTATDASTAEVGLGLPDFGVVTQPNVCSRDELPRITDATITPRNLSTSRLDTESVTVEVWVECFSGPIEQVELAVSDPPRVLTAGVVEEDGHLVMADLDVSAWLGGLPAGAYELVITASSASETLTQRGLTSVEIGE